MNNNNEIVTKICRKCKQEKPSPASFRSQSKSKDGLKSICRECDDQYNRDRYQLKKDKIKQQVRKWQRTHPDKFKAYVRKYQKSKTLKHRLGF